MTHVIHGKGLIHSFSILSYALYLTIPLTALMTPTASIATNGLNQIGFGVESVGMGGADLAVARDTSALNTNPAGLIQVQDARIDVNAAIAYTGNIEHRDEYDNDVSNSNKYPLLGNFGYAAQLREHPVTIGIGFFAQGGTGNEYTNLNTAFGTIDDLSIQFRIARITPGIAWQINDAFTMGASLVGTYSDLEEEVFPNTSFASPVDPSMSFFGYKLTDMNDFNTGIKLGLMYKHDDWLTIGIAFSNKVDLDLKGEMTVDFSALGLGKVNYSNAMASNIDQPQELGIGAAVQASDSLLIAIELNWIKWSDAVTQGTVSASNPDNPAAPSTIQLTIDNYWRDQYVFAVGIAYQHSDRTLFRAGYNYGRNPIPDEHLNPLLNNIAEHHLTFGFGHDLNQNWSIDGTFEWDIRNEVTYTNTQLPFGSDTVAIGELFALHFRISRTW